MSDAVEIRKGSITVKLSNAAYDRVRHYSEVTGVPISRVFNDAVALWMNTEGAARLEVLGEDAAKA